jgi:phosphoribosylformylglycinamidine cyclo-ligase
MTTYEDAGVNIELGDECSARAYAHAKSTFPSRSGMLGQAVTLEGGFSGAQDMGDYYLTHNSDGVGSKAVVAQALGKYDTLGWDLLAMVLDDTVCMGAETLSITNTLDTAKVDPLMTEALLKGLAEACISQKVIIAGGEIAELPGMVNGFTWNASSIGVVAKDRMIVGDRVQVGDKIVGLGSRGFRSNGLSLVRKILTDAFGSDWVHEPYGDGMNWGEAVLVPSRLYSACVLDMIGRFGQPSQVEVHGIAHITGGGIHNLNRVLKKNKLGARLQNLFKPLPVMQKLQELGKVTDEEAYKTWNMGTGMVLVMPQSQVEKALEIAVQHKIPAQVVGEVTAEEGLQLFLA